MHFEASQAVLWALSCYKELKLTTKPFTGCILCSLQIQMQNVSLRSSGKRREQNFEIWGLKVTQQSWLLQFAFTPPLFFCHSSLIFFSLAGHLVCFILVGKVFRKAFRILGLVGRKGKWVVELDFHGNFQVNVTWFFAFFSSVPEWIVLILVWFERSLHSAQVSGQRYPWQSKLMMSQAVERMRICTGCYGRLRGEWVNWCTRSWESVGWLYIARYYHYSPPLEWSSRLHI